MAVTAARQHAALRPDNPHMNQSSRLGVTDAALPPATLRLAGMLGAGLVAFALAHPAQAAKSADAPTTARAAQKNPSKGQMGKPAGAKQKAAAGGGTARPAKDGTVAGPAWGAPEVVRNFAEDVAQRNGLPGPWVLQQLSQARRIQVVRELVLPPPTGTAKNWAAYRARFIEPARITAGVAFWKSAEPWLTRAEQRWGVPAEIVVGIIGVETFYGRVMGNFRIIDALATLAFDFPPGRRDRSEFFKAELEALLVSSHREQVVPHHLKGSFAGAAGLPQFMPSSRTRWAVDMDGDGRIDLSNSLADVVGSVAHYLASFGWQQGMPTHYAVAPPPAGADRAALLAPDILPSFSAEQLAQRGAVLEDTARAHSGPLALVELQNGDAAPSYVAGTQNFYTVTRYNWSSYYAMAVIDLAAAVAQQRANGLR